VWISGNPPRPRSPSERNAERRSRRKEEGGRKGFLSVAGITAAGFA
jgi:hypothetical protein